MAYYLQRNGTGFSDNTTEAIRGYLRQEGLSPEIIAGDEAYKSPDRGIIIFEIHSCNQGGQRLKIVKPKTPRESDIVRGVLTRLTPCKITGEGMQKGARRNLETDILKAKYLSHLEETRAPAYSH